MVVAVIVVIIYCLFFLLLAVVIVVVVAVVDNVFCCCCRFSCCYVVFVVDVLVCKHIGCFLYYTEISVVIHRCIIPLALITLIPQIYITQTLTKRTN